MSRNRGVPGGSWDGTRNSVSKEYARVGGVGWGPKRVDESKSEIGGIRT